MVAITLNLILKNLLTKTMHLLANYLKVNFLPDAAPHYLQPNRVSQLSLGKTILKPNWNVVLPCHYVEEFIPQLPFTAMLRTKSTLPLFLGQWKEL